VPDEIKPGQTAAHSGVYKVHHAWNHADSHYVIILFGETFPVCTRCFASVRFEMVMSAIRINAHPLFMRS
jgi:hypothetical protein